MLRIEALKVSVLNVQRLAFDFQLILILIVVVAGVICIRLRSDKVRRLNVLLSINVVVWIKMCGLCHFLLHLKI